VHAIRKRLPFVDLCTAETGLAAQEILDAGLRAHRSGRRVTV
jgi:predicted dehydrogenase